MTEPTRPTRGAGPEPTGPKKKGTDSEAFKEMMKVGKVRETDPEEQKKAKQQFEVEEDFKAQQTQGGTLQQGLGSSGPSIYDAVGEAEGGGVSSGFPPSGGEGIAAPTPPPAPPPFFPPASDEGDLEIETPSVQMTQSATPSAPSEGGQQTGQKDQKKEETVVVPPPETPQMQMGVGAPPKEETTAVAGAKKGESTEGFFAQLGGKTPQELEKKAAEQAPPSQPTKEALPTLPQGSWESTKESEKKDQKVGGIDKSSSLQPEMQMETGGAIPTGTAPPETAPPVSSPFANLPPHVQAMFERMVGVMTVMDTGGIKETTINLNAPQYQNSLFYGAQIVITEYATAPKEFNIEFIGKQQAMDLASANTNDLLAAFQAGNYNFKVHRIDISIEPSRVEAKKEAQRVKRKKAGGGT